MAIISDYNEPPEIQAAAQRVRAWAFERYWPENWKEPEPAEPKPLRIERPARVTGPANLKSVHRMTGRCPKFIGPKKPKKKRDRSGEYTPNGRGNGWARMGHVTPEAINALKAEGLNQVQIAARLNCAYSVVVKRMVAWRREQGKLAAPTACVAGEHAVNFKGTSTERLIELRAKGMSYAEIGREVGLHYSTVFQRLSYAKKIGEVA